MEQVAYALREQYVPRPDTNGVEQNPDALHGGSITLPDGHSYDIAAALAEQDGVIVTDDLHVAQALSQYFPLRQVPVPTERAEEHKPLAKRTKADLVSFAESQGLTVDDGDTKADVTTSLQEAGLWDEEVAKGDTVQSSSAQGGEF